MTAEEKFRRSYDDYVLDAGHRPTPAEVHEMRAIAEAEERADRRERGEPEPLVPTIWESLGLGWIPGFGRRSK